MRHDLIISIVANDKLTRQQVADWVTNALGDDLADKTDLRVRTHIYSVHVSTPDGTISIGIDNL
jgi:hypothetical protein